MIAALELLFRGAQHRLSPQCRCRSCSPLEHTSGLAQLPRDTNQLSIKLTCIDSALLRLTALVASGAPVKATADPTHTQAAATVLIW
jgi:hypothetical protein